MSKIQDEVKNEGNGSEANYSTHIDIEKIVDHILDYIKDVVAQIFNDQWCFFQDQVTT